MNKDDIKWSKRTLYHWSSLEPYSEDEEDESSADEPIDVSSIEDRYSEEDGEENKEDDESNAEEPVSNVWSVISIEENARASIAAQQVQYNNDSVIMYASHMDNVVCTFPSSCTYMVMNFPITSIPMYIIYIVWPAPSLQLSTSVYLGFLQRLHRPQISLQLETL